MRPIPTVLIAGILLASCVTHAVSDPTVSSHSDLIRTHQKSEDGGMGAIVEGTLEVDLGLGCVWLSAADGSRHPVIWPAGTTTETDPFAVVLPDGRTASHGDLVSGGGGYVDASAATSRTEAFPDECVQDGQAAVFNANAEVEVLTGAGIEAAPTLIGRFSVPESIGIELIAVNPNRRSVALADLVSGTVHLYEPGDYGGPEDAIDGASGGGGFIHLWAQGTVYSYPGRLTDEPLVYRPDPIREIEGIASTLEVVPAPDGEHTWLVQDGSGVGPTLVELVNLVEMEVTRLLAVEVPGSWQPMGTTIDGLVLVSNAGVPRTLLVEMGGSIGAEVAGQALSVGWNGVAIVEDGDLRLLGPDLGGSLAVERPHPGTWTSVGGPSIPTDAPSVRTGGTIQLVGIVEGEGSGGIVHLVVVRQDGSTRVIHQMKDGGVATFSRAEDWVAVADSDGVTLIPGRGEAIRLGDILPDEHWVLTAG